MDDASCTRMLLLSQDHIDAIANDNPLTAFWTSYHDMAQIILGLLRAAREGDWLFHLASIRAMIAWCFAYDKVNYARFLSYYYATMARLPIDHQMCTNSNSSCKVVSVSSLVTRIHSPESLWIKPIEETVNWDTEIHRQQEAQRALAWHRLLVERYCLTSKYRSVPLKQFRKMVGRGMRHLSHPDLHITRNEADVQSIVKLLDDNWTNHFDPK